MECKKCGEVVPCEECLPGVRLEALRENLRHVDREGLLRMLLEAEDARDAVNKAIEYHEDALSLGLTEFDQGRQEGKRAVCSEVREAIGEQE